jgi:putative glutamine transport system substrate-binding protein
MKHKKLTILFLFVFSLTNLKAQENASWETINVLQKGELNVNYFENAPFAYTNNKGQLNGIEIDILNYFKDWLLKTKGIELKLNFTKSTDFNSFYTKLKNSPINTVGAGTVSITNRRQQEVRFSPPYLNNISVLISDGTIPNSKNREELLKTFYELRPVTIEGSIHENHITKLMKDAETYFELTYVKSPRKVTDKILGNPKYYGYIDIISYWQFLKTNSRYVKMHRAANIEGEKFAFIFPLESDWQQIFNEFFETGFGFTSTKDYRDILEKHLGYEILNKVELD